MPSEIYMLETVKSVMPDITYRKMMGEYLLYMNGTCFRHPTPNFQRLPIAAADGYAHAFGMGSEYTQKRFRIQFQ